jgi:hypothetical protein
MSNFKPDQGCQMVYFQTKNSNLDVFRRALECKMLVYFIQFYTAIWYNLWHFGIVCGHLVYFCPFGMFGPGKIWQP